MLIFSGNCSLHFVKSILRDILLYQRSCLKSVTSMENQTKPGQSDAPEKGESSVTRDAESIHSDESGPDAGGPSTGSTPHSSESTSGIEIKCEQPVVPSSSSDEPSESRILESFPPISSDEPSGGPPIDEELKQQTSTDEPSALKQAPSEYCSTEEMIQHTPMDVPSHHTTDVILEHTSVDDSSHQTTDVVTQLTSMDESSHHTTDVMEQKSIDESTRVSSYEQPRHRFTDEARPFTPGNEPSGFRLKETKISTRIYERERYSHVEDVPPAFGDETPSSEDVPPAFGDETPSFEDETPSFEDETPSFEDEPPMYSIIHGAIPPRRSSGPSRLLQPAPYTVFPDPIPSTFCESPRRHSVIPQTIPSTYYYSEEARRHSTIPEPLPSTCSEESIVDPNIPDLQIDPASSSEASEKVPPPADKSRKKSRSKSKSPKRSPVVETMREGIRRVRKSLSPKKSDSDEDKVIPSPKSDSKLSRSISPIKALFGKKVPEKKVPAEDTEPLLLGDELRRSSSSTSETTPPVIKSHDEELGSKIRHRQKRRSKERSPKDKSPKRKSSGSLERMDTTHQDDTEKYIPKWKKHFNLHLKTQKPVSSYEGLETSESDAAKETTKASKPKKHQKTEKEIARQRVNEAHIFNVSWPSDVRLTTDDAITASPTQTDLDLDSLSSFPDDAATGTLVDVTTDAPAQDVVIGAPVVGVPPRRLSETEREVTSRMSECLDLEDAAEEGTSDRGRSVTKRQMTEGMELKAMLSPQKQPKYDKEMPKDGGSSHSSESDKEEM